MITLTILCLAHTFYVYHKIYKKCKKQEIEFNFENFMDNINFLEWISVFCTTIIAISILMILILKYLP